jgi:hypothetical protein
MYVILLFAFVFGFYSCSGDDNPAQAVNSFYDSVKEGNYSEARGFLTKNANSMYSDTDLDFFRRFFKDVGDIVQPYPDRLTITGNTATEPIIKTYSTDYYVTLDISLVKYMGKWKINSINRNETKLRVESSFFCSEFLTELGPEA